MFWIQNYMDNTTEGFCFVLFFNFKPKIPFIEVSQNIFRALYYTYGLGPVFPVLTTINRKLNTTVNITNTHVNLMSSDYLKIFYL